MSQYPVSTDDGAVPEAVSAPGRAAAAAATGGPADAASPGAVDARSRPPRPDQPVRAGGSDGGAVRGVVGGVPGAGGRTPIPRTRERKPVAPAPRAGAATETTEDQA
ncbi:hypothetical protein [Kitasatospora sp. NBC_00458]|uniref:hypothetical protein n=1 Tax=Kitasatospora sp. NBC_00458 TaxID=2903568 RepID=UPI002E17A2A5